MASLDSFKCLRPLKVGSKTYAYYSLPAAEKSGLKGISRLPFSLKVLLENLLRNEDGRSVSKDDILAVAQERLAGLMRTHLAEGGLVLAATHGPLGIAATRELRLDDFAGAPASASEVQLS